MNNKNDAPPNQHNDNNPDFSLTAYEPKDSEVLPNYLINTVPKDYDEKNLLLDTACNKQRDPWYCNSDDNAVEAKNMEEAFEDAIKEHMLSRLHDDSDENVIITKKYG